LTKTLRFSRFSFISGGGAHSWGPTTKLKDSPENRPSKYGNGPSLTCPYKEI